MERRINCRVFTPDGPVYSGDVELAVLPAFDGSIGFLYNHAPLIEELGAGEVRLTKGHDTDYLYIEGGFAEIFNNELSIFPLKASLKEDISEETVLKEMEDLKQHAKTPDHKERERIAGDIRKLKLKLKVAGRNKK